MAVQTVGDNVKIDVKGNVATITINLAERFGKSPSGKTVRVAMTGGNVSIDGTDVVLGLNAYVKA